MNGTISQAEMVERLTGGKRTEAEMFADGARVAISQIDKLRRQLDEAERAAQFCIRNGRPRKDDNAVWKRVAKAADRLLEGMV